MTIPSVEQAAARDLVVLDRNPLTVAPEELISLKIVETIMEGKSLYRAGT